MASATSCIARGRIDGFLERALEPQVELRRGQKLMNELYWESQALYDAISQTSCDPYYDDAKLWAAVAWIRDNWKDYHK